MATQPLEPPNDGLQAEARMSKLMSNFSEAGVGSNTDRTNGSLAVHDKIF